MSSYETILSRYNLRVSKAWEKLTAKLLTNAQRKPFSNHALWIVQNYISNPGKLIRPSLFLAGYELVGNKKITVAIIELALSLELLHLYLLIHDDVMDQGETRRGQPSLHKQFESYHREQKCIGDPVRYGENMAILFGDAVNNYADMLWTKAMRDKTVSIEARAVFEAAKDAVYWGQYGDIFLSNRGEEPTQTDLNLVMLEKTAKYSFLAPLHLGYEVATHQKPQKWLSDYALNLGLCFQIIDDIIGSLGTQAVTGKSTSDDIKERKLTHLVSIALQAANSSDKKILTQHYIKGQPVGTNVIKTIFQTYGVETKTRAIAHHYYQNALLSLAKSDLPKKNKALFKEFADFLVNREK